MVELKENDKIKVQVKKAPAKKGITPKIASGTDAIHQAEEQETRINKVVDNTKILAKNLKEQDKRLNSIMDTNKTLIEKHKIIKEDNLAIVIPRDYIRDVVESVVLSVNNQLMDSVEECQEFINVLERGNFDKQLGDLKDLGKLKKRISDLEYQVEELPDNYWVEDEINSMTSEFVNEYEVEDIVVEKINRQIDATDFVSEKRFIEDIAELQKQLRSVERILGNEIIQLKNRGIFKRFGRFIINVTERYLKWFEKCYNFKSKVRSKLFSNNK